MTWTGRVLSALAVIFLVFDAVIKLMRVPQVLQATAQLGYPESSIPVMAVLLLGSTFIYVVPRTRVLGAVLLTGYLGGAVATHLRVGNPLFEMTFPVMLGAIVWTGIVLSDARVRALLFASRDMSSARSAA